MRTDPDGFTSDDRSSSVGRLITRLQWPAGNGLFWGKPIFIKMSDAEGPTEIIQPLVFGGPLART